MSFLKNLQCSNCSTVFDPDRLQTFCPICQSPLLAKYNFQNAREHIDRDQVRLRPRGMWRWQEMLPVKDPLNIVSLGEGDAPLLDAPRLGASLGLKRLYVKDEGMNPTGSFKARGLAVAISKAKELGVENVIIPTAGNAGGAMAAYAARAGLRAHIFMPKDTPIANVEECRITGATITLIDGLISDAARLAGIKAREEDWFDVSTFKEPYRTEGKKVMGYELAEFFDWQLPDVIVYPTGGGTGLVGMWKAFQELEDLGWLETKDRPRMVAVQAEGCAPIIKAFRDGAEFSDFWIDAKTIASGLRIPKSFADRLILGDLRESNGTAIAVSDEAILKAQSRLAVAEGIFSAPEGAATLAALEALVEQNWVQANERIVLFNTGTGLKYIKS